MIPHEETTEIELTTDAGLEAHVAELLERAIRRQWWTLYLDADDRLALLMPMADYPDDPAMPVYGVPDFEGDAAGLLALRLAEVCEIADAKCLVFVWERPGGPASTRDDRNWAKSLGAACAARGVRVRGQLILHDGGVRWFAPDDYA